MNQVFLQKLVYQEELNVKVQLVKEHIDIAKQEWHQIQENLDNIKMMSLLAEQAESDDRTSWEGEPLAASQEFLKSMPNSTERTMGRNKVSYEVVVDIPPAGEKKTAFKNKLRFYSDGSVYDYNLATTLGYKFGSNKITIVAKNPDALISVSENKDLATIDSNGKFTSIDYTVPSTKSKVKKIPWLDTLQTVLDFAGLIPVIGDAIDVINAIIYFWRGLYFEGFLSLIAIIPVVGSAIKLGVKGALKGVKAGLFANKLVQKWFLKGETKAMAELMTTLMKNGLPKKQALQMASSFTAMGGKLKGAAKGAANVTGNSVVTRNLDKAGDSITDAARTIDATVDEIRAAEKAAEVAKKAAEEGAKIWRMPKKALNFMTFGMLPKLKKMPFYPAKKLAAMTAETQARFIAKSAKRPDRLGVLTKFAGKESREAMAKGIGDSIQNMSKYNQSEILFQFTRKNSPLRKYYKPGQGTKGIGAIDFNSLFKSAENTEDFFKLINKNPKLASEVMPSLGKSITNRAVKDGNPFWHIYRDDVGNKLLSSQTAKVIQTQFAKNVDWIWNEMQAAGETLGFESREHLSQFGIVPFTKFVLASQFPGGYKKMQDIKNAMLTAVGMAGDVVKTAAGTMGIQLDNLEEYPALGAEEYTYGQDETEE